ncbi:unnamed protein product [Rotaria sp. Silwood2]|nr:unnamed protein product [Rotaria sp. Silwood2]CAF3290933.1 unnamed protein product [Rotaria sp. Silwood2]CAF4020003.1 unnamed protein product [Rotaria sp. Silwood2]CAF4145809.1 unnamed protein product [Rotaria sp. Silwood2]
MIVVHLILATPQINLYNTDCVSENENNNALQHDCLRVVASNEEANINRQIISYCMSELQSKFHIEKTNVYPKFTFAELSKQNITSQQLYIWSAPIDIVEHYEFYLNQLSTSNDLSIATQVFYNCTLPRFGPMCQYEIDYYYRNYSSLYEIIHDYYRTQEYNPTNFTCYTHLQCNRGPLPACLDWSEICDGQIDCLDGDFDEEHCWQLETNQCKDDEYRCTNGQCIPWSFFRDDTNASDCVDRSDEVSRRYDKFNKCNTDKPSFECEDITCRHTFLTNSCVVPRQRLLVNAIYSITNNSVSQQCWSAFKCVLNVPDSEKPFCKNVCETAACLEIINNTCPDMFHFPNVPVLFGHAYFAHTKNDSLFFTRGGSVAPYLCYRNSRYDEYFIRQPKILFNNETCFRPQGLPVPSIFSTSWELNYHIPLNHLYKELKAYNLIFNYNSAICNASHMYQCVNSSKCIPTNRLLDVANDCPQREDENITYINNTGLTKKLKSHFKCELADKYIHQSFVADGTCNCLFAGYRWCEDESSDVHYARKNISFQTICDGFTELIPITIEGRNETDETECENWSCNNMYTRCDGLWNCLHGEDEIGCYLSSTFNCSPDHHICVSPDTNQFMCLSIQKANDGKIDCVGATDESTLCQKKYEINVNYNFYCRNTTYSSCISSEKLCDRDKNCKDGDDEQFCVKNRTNNTINRICRPSYVAFGSDVEKFLCYATRDKIKQQIKYFSLDGMSKSVETQTKNVTRLVFSSSSIIKISHQHERRCHRGLDLRVWLNHEKNLTTNTCLCPPSFYGNICQYQNQRVSLTIKFRALSDSWSTLFAMIISLIDDTEERIINSYEQFTYLSIRDCKIKFNIYLLYSNRPKNLTNNYAIHIDIYEKASLTYRGSLLFPITFPFLPVYRLAFIADIPRNDKNIESCSNPRCIHGKCIRYSNNLQNTSFCQCYQGWSGQYCTIPHTCMCSSDSLCIGTSANNRSVCVCPVHKFGARCLLINTMCQIDNNLTCQNDGQCIPTNEYMITDQAFHCICPKGYIGDRCEIVDNKITLLFEKDFTLSQSIFIHFIEVVNNGAPIRATTFRTIPRTQDSLIIYWARPFHLVFIELINKIYYLAITQKSYQRSTTIVKMINPLDRCQHINELFNETFIQLHILRRIKYYHLPCQIYSSNISCFYDDIHMCLCYDFGQQRLANCFEFNHNMTFDCLGQSVCENGGQCFQDKPDCPQRSMCICRSCFYGTRCQFSTSGFGLSLDGILGYHILPYTRIIHQPKIVKISFGLTIIFMVAGFINGVLALITFNNKLICEVGCGVYLLGLSIATLFTTIIFGLKFSILVLGQMAYISNRLFLQIQCISLDFLLHVSLTMDQWLNACVATERAITMIKATHFQKKKSKQVAKKVIVILLIVIIGTSIYDPLYRRIIDEENEDEKRIWCVATYPSSLQIFNSVINTFHFLAPFMINLISAVILITKISRQQTNLQTHRTYTELLREQIRRHRHLFAAPVLLVILALPRLIISYVSKCMKSTNEAWLFLIGYFISFIPPMLTFVVFILPSKFYKTQFRKSVVAYRTKIQRYLQVTTI